MSNRNAPSQYANLEIQTAKRAARDLRPGRPFPGHFPMPKSSIYIRLGGTDYLLSLNGVSTGHSIDLLV